jgi:hypothetical protein
MNSNPYVPPKAEVKDINDASKTRRSRIVMIASTITAIVGGLALVLGYFTIADGLAQEANVVVNVVVVVYGLVACAAAIGLYRQIRWVAVAWMLICGLPLFLPLTTTAVPFRLFTFIALLMAQPIVVLLALVTILRRDRER